VEFDSIAERLYAVVRLTAKDTGKQVKLDLSGGTIEMDRGVLERMVPAFEHLLRNCVDHGIEQPAQRQQAGKPATGTISIQVQQAGNDVAVTFQDDGAGLDVARIRQKALEQGLITPEEAVDAARAAQLVFMPGFTTAQQLTGVSGRGIGMDVVRSEVQALGGRIETETEPGKGSAFRLVLPLTTAVTQVVMLRAGDFAVGVPASLVEMVRRVHLPELEAAYHSGVLVDGDERIPFYWAGAVWSQSPRSVDVGVGKTRPVIIFRSASQRIALHVDEVLGHQEVVVKNLGPQMSRLPGLTGMSVLASGAVVLIYNPVALTAVYGDKIRQLGEGLPALLDEPTAKQLQRAAQPQEPVSGLVAASQVPLVMVVDDSITVRRVSQRLLQREGYRVVTAADGLQALEKLQGEVPCVVLSDIEMPRMDGFDLLRNIRAQQALQQLPIIMITSRIAQKHRDHAMELGANHYLGKPYSDEELMGLVHHYALGKPLPAASGVAPIAAALSAAGASSDD
jgi:chemosensory pili system protein ChpA (sensor histidine kinase/response regulator)